MEHAHRCDNRTGSILEEVLQMMTMNPSIIAKIYCLLYYYFIDQTTIKKSTTQIVWIGEVNAAKCQQWISKVWIGFGVIEWVSPSRITSNSQFDVWLSNWLQPIATEAAHSPAQHLYVADYIIRSHIRRHFEATLGPLLRLRLKSDWMCWKNNMKIINFKTVSEW